MSARSVNAAAAEICRAMENGRQTPAGWAMALDAKGMLQTPETAAELAAYRALDLGTAEGRVSAKCADPKHPVWLRDLDDVRGCPWCRIAELEAERHSTNEALVDVTEALRGKQEAASPDACQACGALPESWCPDCAACEQGCFGGFDGNACTHSNAKWGGVS